MSDTKPSAYAQLNTKFEAMSQREKGLMLGAGLASILLLGFVLAVEPALLQTDRFKQEVSRKSNELVALERQVGQLEDDLRKDPNAALVARLGEISGQTEAFEDRLAQQTQDLVHPQDMPALLENLLSKSGKLKLIELQSIAPTRLLTTKEEQTSGALNLYQHGVRIQLEGKYFDIQKYMEQVESMPWRLYWKKFDYRVTEHPLAEVEIELYTLSTSSAFIGVWNDG